MRNYDELRAQTDMSFTICGETFTLGPASAMQYDKWEKEEKDAVQNGQTTAEIVLTLANRVILSLLSPEDGKRWKAVLKRPDGPTIAELSDLRRWVIEVQTDLPTMPPGPSDSGRSETVGSSKAA